ncbi:DMT family transporter [Agrobacterium tumefaciens]|uniref:DMT family transporter n=1 Tax=Agrobacterium tumefaciens TaxID=358 RepID=UPI00287E70BC|nr:DMT family transporter [Agrobacterium tumefaciens]MDS7595733.1 DMT family transporter [Agrobacterium tumefaciens]
MKARAVETGDNKAKATVMMLIAVSLFAGLDSTAKLSGQDVPAIEVVWFRFMVHFILVSVILNPWRTPGAWRTSAPKLQLARAAVQIICTGLNFLALSYLQIAQTLSIQFMGPIFVTLLSVFFLGEVVGRYRWSAIFISFIGVLIITRPGVGEFNPAFGIIILSVLIGASYSIMTRRLATTESSGSMLLIMAALPAIILTPVMPFVWVWPTDASVWLALVGTGVFGAVSHYFYIQAHRYAQASFLAPLQYFQFLAVLLLGFFVFGDVPTIWTLIGTLVLIGSGLFIWHRERKLTHAGKSA